MAGATRTNASSCPLPLPPPPPSPPAKSTAPSGAGTKRKAGSEAGGSIGCMGCDTVHKYGEVGGPSKVSNHPGWWCRCCGGGEKYAAMRNMGLPVKEIRGVYDAQRGGADDPLIPCFVCNRGGSGAPLPEEERMACLPDFWVNHGPKGYRVSPTEVAVAKRRRTAEEGSKRGHPSVRDGAVVARKDPSAAAPSTTPDTKARGASNERKGEGASDMMEIGEQTTKGESNSDSVEDIWGTSALSSEASGCYLCSSGGSEGCIAPSIPGWWCRCCVKECRRRLLSRGIDPMRVEAICGARHMKPRSLYDALVPCFMCNRQGKRMVPCGVACLPGFWRTHGPDAERESLKAATPVPLSSSPSVPLPLPSLSLPLSRLLSIERREGEEKEGAGGAKKRGGKKGVPTTEPRAKTAKSLPLLPAPAPSLSSDSASEPNRPTPRSPLGAGSDVKVAAKAGLKVAAKERKKKKKAVGKEGKGEGKTRGKTKARPSPGKSTSTERKNTAGGK